MAKKIKCPFCKSDKKKRILRLSKVHLLICAKCELGYIDPIPKKDELLKYYGKDYFESGVGEFIRYKNYQSLGGVLKKEAQKKISEIEKYTNKKKLLDIGCGLGDFLKVAKEKNFEVAANDISSYVQKYITSILRVPFFKGTISKKVLPPNQFDIITAWDVFEHIPQVNEAFVSISQALKKGGFLFLTTPNLRSPDARLLGRFWYGYKKIPEHLIFFSPNSIRKILTTHGFKVIIIKNWGFERDIAFLITKLGLYIPFLGQALMPIAKFLKLDKKSLYLPLTDMFVVAQKIK